MGLLTRINTALDRWSTCKHCHHNGYIATCACTARTCVCWAERAGGNTSPQGSPR
ncbi:hypothetical protein [Crossiella sp. CA198]|uniref:hypothetical protein n=1 Tax=Crossiella sp. CA198 TaxID=3455607 RepID=UPI003F8D0758